MHIQNSEPNKVTVSKVNYLDSFHVSSHLVGVQLTRMWEVKFRCKNMNKAAFHSLFVNIFSNKLANKVLSCAGPSVQREHQGLLRVFITHESSHSFQDDA